MSTWQISHSHFQIPPATLQKVADGRNALLQRRDLGFWQVTEREWIWNDSQTRGTELASRYDTLAVVGIGGSSLGARALLQSCEPFTNGKNILFFDNVDAFRFYRKLESYPRWGKTHWLLISKSGNTIETLATADFVDQWLRNNGKGRLKDHCTVVSEKRDNPLVRWANQEGVSVYEVPVDIGGRFSVFTPVGLIPASFAGLTLSQLREGARIALENRELIESLAAHALFSFSEQKPISLFWAYCDDLTEWGRWIQQLWAESLGKAEGRSSSKPPKVSTPMFAIGATDQHSILQQVAEGERDKFLYFIRVGQSESTGAALESTLFEGQDLLVGKTLGQLLAAEAQATIESLREKGVGSVGLFTDQLTTTATAELLMTFMLVIGVLGEALDIDAFNQPGVEAGKKRAKEIIRG